MRTSYPLLIALFVFFSLWLFPVFGQSTFQRVLRTIDSSSIQSSDLLPLPDGYLLAGTSQVGTRPILMKIGADGHLVWLKRYADGIDRGEFIKVIPANDGGFLAVGTSGSFAVILLIKTDANGHTQWQKIIPSFDTNRQNSGLSVLALADGYLISGITRRNSTQAALIRIDNQGEMIWSKRYTNTSSENFLLKAAFVSGDTIFASGFRDKLALFTLFDAATGSVLSNTVFDAPFLEGKLLEHLVPAANGDLMLGGIIGGNGGNPGPVVEPRQWMCRISRTGVVKWSKIYSNFGLGPITALSGDHFLIVTSTNINIGYPERKGLGLTKIDGQGTVEWSYQYGLTDLDFYPAAVETPDGGILAHSLVANQIMLVRTDANGLVAGCCRRPNAVEVAPVSVMQTPEALVEVGFDGPQETLISEQNDTLFETEYCPAVANEPQHVDVVLCPGDSIVIGGTTYTGNAEFTYIDHGPDCDFTILYSIQLGAQPTLEKTFSLCPGDSLTVDGWTFTEAGSFTRTIPALTGGCDTLVTYNIQGGISPGLEKTFSLCPGDSLTVDGWTFTQPGTYTQTLPSTTGGCDTLVTYHIEAGVGPVSERTVSFCPGDSIVIDGVTFTQPGIFTQMVPSTTGGCDTLVIYTIDMGVNPTRAETVSFCAGDSVTVAGMTFTEPTTFVRTVPATTGCDTLVTYTIQYSVPATSTTLTLTCPANFSVEAPAGAVSLPVVYAGPVVQGDCICPGDQLQQTGGPASGDAFPVGTTTLCFAAQDHCGLEATCCFQVTVTAASDDPCDVKVNGCLRFELQGITRDAQFRRTYHVRVQNNCAQSLTYAAFQLPDGVIAYAPQNNATYVAPSGRAYTVRNPNNAPMHSIRFSAQGSGIQNGEADVFQYTLPPYAAPAYIHALVKLTGVAAQEVYLNTFNCPVEAETANRSLESDLQTIALFPNPVENVLIVDLRGWSASSTALRVFNVQGQVVLSQTTTESGSVILPLDLPSGVYLLEASTAGGVREVKRFVVR